MNEGSESAESQPIDLEMIDRSDRLVNRLGSGLLFHEQTLAHASSAGIDDALVLYAGGGAGVMGDVNACRPRGPAFSSEARRVLLRP